MDSIIKNILGRISFSKEPAVLIAVAFIVVLTGYKVFGPEHMPISDVFSEEYATYVGALVASILTRLQVFSKETVDDLVTKAE